ncbi:MAG: hypothetical protein BGO67_01960 [Alphaproteobacteria bacterium 41-28]|nr:MAG: hypothetical protein BGO67_01960 [Alphaproteobacteria bacterium 41-28]
MIKKKILFVAMQMSIHTTRWINQLEGQGYDIHLFPINHMPVHLGLKNITVHEPFINLSHILFLKKIKNFLKWIFRREEVLLSPPLSLVKYKSIYKMIVLSRLLPYFSRLCSYKFGTSDAKIPELYGPRTLKKLITMLKPDLIHSLEFQTCGYNVLFAKKQYKKGKFPQWLATNWGSDIYYYKDDPAHSEIIKDLLSQIDHYSCECQRDVDIVKKLGYVGSILPVIPNTGGVDIKFARKLREKFTTSSRKLIMIKGYQNFAGRALMALDVIVRCAHLLKDYKIIVYSATPDVEDRVNQMNQQLNIPIEILPYTEDYSKMLELFSQARIYFTISVSDGISTSLLEAMAMGAFPIQTNTACCDEWIKDGESGFITSPDNFEGMTKALKLALSDDALVDKASQLNWETILKKASKEKCKKIANAFYTSIFNDVSIDRGLHEHQ